MLHTKMVALREKIIIYGEQLNGSFRNAIIKTLSETRFRPPTGECHFQTSFQFTAMNFVLVKAGKSEWVRMIKWSS